MSNASEAAVDNGSTSGAPGMDHGSGDKVHHRTSLIVQRVTERRSAHHGRGSEHGFVAVSGYRSTQDDIADAYYADTS